MFLIRLFRTALLAVLAVLPLAAHADDTDIFTVQQTGSSAAAPNILFIVDNTANWSDAAQHWDGSPTQGQAELAAIQKFVKGLNQPANVGIMMLTVDTQTKRDGGYVRFGIRDMMNSANNAALQKLLGYIDVNTPLNEINQSSGDYANALYEAWLYLTGANSWAGMDPLADYSGNSNGNPNGSPTSPTTSSVGLSSGFAYKGSNAGALYNNPLAGDCGKTFIIFIGNNRASKQGGMPPTPPATDPSMTTLAQYKYITTPDAQSAWARFLLNRPDLGAGTAAAQNGQIRTFTIDAYHDKGNSVFTTMMKNMAQQGGGSYYQAGSDTDLQLALQSILTRILAVNSVFASVSLPVSVSVRGTYLNQVYMGMFRPDANAKPNWVGNLKQYQLAADTTTTPPTVFLADANKVAVENQITGFVNPDVTSFWTQASTFWDATYYPFSQGSGGTSDSPDGDLVEKGGAAQYLRTKFATDQSGRNAYTCIGSCAATSALSATPFNSKASITATSLGLASGANTEPVINWVRGGNTLSDDNPTANSSSPPPYNVRGFLHGDVLHSRPAVINYNRKSLNYDDVVVYYGANDGMLHAMKGGQTTGNGDGNELWTFLPSEHFSKFARMYNHSPTISSSNPKPYFVDGSPTVYTYATQNDGTIDFTRGDKAYLFLTMRRGGQFMYALDVSDPLTPKLLWKHSSTDAGFGELGQTWSDLRVARIRASSNPVLIFGLGYDDAANDPVTQGTATKGRGVMVLDAVTGNILWQAGPSSTVGQAMTYAIPANVAVIDSDRDGYADRIYAADTGANIWRININDSSPSNWTVTLLAKLRSTANASDARKFLFAPDVVPATSTNPYDTLLIGSGDREHPFDTSVVNRFYMINDSHDLNNVRSTPITEANLYDATADLLQMGTATQVATAKAQLAAANGWFITLGTGEKVVSGSTTLAGTVIFSTNTPQTAVANKCTSNLGEARIYQLNYLNGTAAFDTNKSGTLTIADRYQVRAGGGYPPTPVPVSVKIGDNIYDVAVSGTQVITPTGPQLGRRYRTFWRRGVD